MNENVTLTPDLVGRDYDAEVRNNRSYIDEYLFYVTLEYSDTVEKGCIIRQSPEAGEVIQKGDTVSLVVSRGPQMMEMPDVIGQTQDSAVQELATKPLTLILPGASGVAANLIPEEGTLGVRIPDHAFCQAMLRKLGRPIVSTSANISGEDTPRNLAEISREIIDGVDYVVNPKFEGKPTGKASSILLFNEAGEFRIIRE